MFSTGTRKVIRDLMQEKRRTLTVLLAMVIGVFAVAMMSNSKSLLNNNLTENYLRTNPASFSLAVNSVDDNTISQLRAMPEIKEVTTRQTIWTRMKKPDGTFLPIMLFVVDDVQNPLINTYNLDEGSFPKGKNEIIIERTGKRLEPLQTGQTFEMHLPGYAVSTYTISGFTHDPGIAPSWMEGFLCGYISASSLPSAYLAKFSTEVKCIVAEDEFNLAHIEAVARKTKGMLAKMDTPVINAEIHEPGVHIHQKQMNALMFLILNFGILALILSCFLIINMISAIMAKEKKQIAIMKATGASSFQIARIYLFTILIMAVVALVIGTPLGIIAGEAFATFNASMLNFELFDVSVAPMVLLVIILTGVCLPVMISLLPIINSSRVSVQTALNDTGVEDAVSKSRFFTPIVRMFSGSFLLAMRNAFRRKTRLALTVISLSIGGAIFITAFNIQEATNNAVNMNFDGQPQDILYTLTAPVEAAKLNEILGKMEVDYELGFTGKGSFVQENGLSSNAFTVTAIDESAKLITPVMLKGRWITEGEKEVVVNQIFYKENSSLKIGDKMNLTLKGKSGEYEIVGVFQQMFTPAGLMMSKDQYATHLGLSPTSGNYILIDALTDRQKDIATIDIGIEKALKANGVSAVNSITKAAYKTAVVEHLLIIMAMLMSMTVLVLIVGGLGMATSININVSERIRELGILRAIGILNRNLRAMVMTEAITMGGLSWIAAIALAIPLSTFLGNEFFTIFFESSMDMAISFTGIGIWLVLAVVIGSLSSIIPANRVIKREITEALNYE